mgnify:CR=1 FL=1
MDRRFDSRVLIRLAVFVAVFVAPYHTFAAGRPNIVIIMADDMGYSDAGCYGSEIATPNLDRLAANGLRYTQFYNTARCCPTRASLLTGLYPHRAGMGWMTGGPRPHPGYRGTLSHDAVTIAEVLRPAGYATYMSGKWHVTADENPDRPKDNWPRQRGFDRYYGIIKGGGSYFDPATLTRDNTPITPDSDPEYRPDRYYLTDAIADQAARFIREHAQQSADKPFFLYCAFTSPHWPLHALEEDIAKYRGRYDVGYEAIRTARFERMKKLGVIAPDAELSPAPDRWEDVENKAWEARCMEVYAAQIDRMDQGIGRILDALRETGQFDNTLVLFLQDNGACAEDMGREIHEERMRRTTTQPMKPTDLQLSVFPAYTRDGRPIRDGTSVMPGPANSFIAYGRGWATVSSTPFREYKHWVHEGGISTPLIAHWPAGLRRRGELEHTPGHLIDLMPTCVELAGAEYPRRKGDREVPPAAGVSLLPTFRGEPLRRTEPIFFEHEGNRAVRDSEWKLVAKGAQGPWELYNIRTDRSELHDVAADHPERVRAMAAAWETWARENQVLPLGAYQRRGGQQQRARSQPR